MKCSRARSVRELAQRGTEDAHLHGAHLSPARGVKSLSILDVVLAALRLRAFLDAVYGLGVVLRNLCCGCGVSFTMPLKRTHADGIRCSIHEDNSTHYTISVTYRQSHASFLACRETTLDGAKRIADDEVRKSGHVCDGKDWEAT